MLAILWGVVAVSAGVSFSFGYAAGLGEAHGRKVSKLELEAATAPVQTRATLISIAAQAAHRSAWVGFFEFSDGSVVSQEIDDDFKYAPTGLRATLVSANPGWKLAKDPQWSRR